MWVQKVFDPADSPVPPADSLVPPEEDVDLCHLKQPWAVANNHVSMLGFIRRAVRSAFSLAGGYKIFNLNCKLWSNKFENPFF